MSDPLTDARVAGGRPGHPDRPVPILVNYNWDAWVTDPDDAAAFERDYMQLIDRLAAEGFDAIAIWGFLRDAHGGVASARRVARHARAAGVRLLPGIGVFCYGGTYNEGEHPYNLETHHREHPELRGLAPDGSDSPLCPSKPENQRWMEDSLRWLYKEIPEIGGVHFETGDGDEWLCVCPVCQAATAGEEGRGGISGSIVDMVRLLPPLGEVVTACDPDAWNTYATYNCFWHPAGRVDPRCTDEDIEHTVPLERFAPLKDMPSGYHANWCKGLLDRFELRDEDRPPTPEPNWLDTWFTGSYPGDERVGWGWQARWAHRGFFPNVTRVRGACEQIVKAGISGLNLEGGYHPSLLDNRLTLAATGYFAQHPAASEQDFVEHALVPEWGEQARSLWGWVRPYEDWAWAIHATTYHFHAVVHESERTPWPVVKLDEAAAANHRALLAAQADLARASEPLAAYLTVAVQRLWEQDRILAALLAAPGTWLRELLADAAANRADVAAALTALRSELADLPSCWL